MLLAFELIASIRANENSSFADSGSRFGVVGSVHLIKGDDEVLVAQALGDLVAELVADADRALMVEEVTEAHYAADGDPDLTSLVTAAQTPPFLTERRVVIGRNMALFTRADQVAGLVDWMAEPTDTTDLVLVWERGAATSRLGAVPKSLREAIKAAGGREVDAAPSGKGRRALVDRQLADAPLRFDAAARAAITDQFGDDAGRIRPLIEVLVSTHGAGSTLSVDDVTPFLGEASDVPPWELTDAIDNGDIGSALDRLHRMMGGGDRHPLQILATLHGHYQRALALDGAGVADERSAADVLGLKGSTFPAKKALGLTRRLGPDRIREVMLLLGDADLDLRGHSAMPADAVMDVLVARLARLSR